jgi:hypothetical protein
LVVLISISMTDSRLETVSQRIFRTPGVLGLLLDSDWCG